MKCTNCGNAVLKPFESFHGDMASNVDAYFCTRCGHVEFFVKSTCSEWKREKAKQEIEELTEDYTSY